MFSPSEWGNCTKVKGIFQPDMKEKYKWKKDIPFLPINSGKNPAHLGDLIKMKNYLLGRFQSEILPHLDFQTQRINQKLDIRHYTIIASATMQFLLWKNWESNFTVFIHIYIPLNILVLFRIVLPAGVTGENIPRTPHNSSTYIHKLIQVSSLTNIKMQYQYHPTTGSFRSEI